MTETTTEPGPDLSEQVTQVPDVEDAPDQAATGDDNPGREAARYRRQLRETEAERDGLLTQLDALRRAEVDRLVADQTRTLKPAALWAAGTELGQLLAEDGTVDAARVAEAIKAASDTLGIATRLPVAPSSAGQGNVGEAVYSGQPGNGWQAAFGPKTH